MPDLRELDLNQPTLAMLSAYMIEKCARYIMLTKAPTYLNNCVMASRIGMEVMKHYDVRNARSAAVAITCGNPRYTELVEEHGRVPLSHGELMEWREQGAYVHGVTGHRKEAPQPGHWNGHLITLGEEVLLDLSLDQMTRPQHDIDVETFCGPVGQEFLRGEERAAFLSGTGCLITYNLEPWNDEWMTSLDWNQLASYRPVIDAIIEEIDNMDNPLTLVRTS